MSDWKPMTEDELEDYETRDSREEFLKASLIDAHAELRHYQKTVADLHEALTQCTVEMGLINEDDG